MTHRRLPASATDPELRASLAGGARTLGLSLQEAQIDALLTYARRLAQWNATYNLTAIRDPAAVVTQHLLDSLAAAAALLRRDPAGPRRILDVGSGAGLPGVVLGVALPTAEVVCVDKVEKKTAFITHAAATMGIANVTAIHARVEAIRSEPFDVVTSRAFATLQNFVDSTRRLLADNGAWMAMKGKVPAAEIDDLQHARADVEQLRVPGLDADRCIVWMRPS